MSEGKRPGGLTALSVINFVFAGFRFLSVLSTGVMLALLSASNRSVVMKNATVEARSAIEKVNIGRPFLIFFIVVGVISIALLIASGIGYLKQKKMLGRMVGNVAALVSIIMAVASVMMVSGKVGVRYNLGFFVSLIYPLLTLILLNTTFKEDFINQ
jgi:hypothetical protein